MLSLRLMYVVRPAANGPSNWKATTGLQGSARPAGLYQLFGPLLSVVFLKSNESK